MVVPPIHLQGPICITRLVANYDDKSTHATSLVHAASSEVIASQYSSHKAKQYLTSKPPCSTLISERKMIGVLPIVFSWILPDLRKT